MILAYYFLIEMHYFGPASLQEPAFGAGDQQRQRLPGHFWGPSSQICASRGIHLQM
jgi:hypothetical protein